MSLNVGMELPVWKGNGHVFVSSVKPSADLRLFEQYECPNTCAPKYDFSTFS